MTWVWIALGIYVLVVVGAVWFSAHPPRIPVFFSPGMLGLTQEDVEFRTSDGVLLRGWWVPSDGTRTVAILAHGYLMNRSELAPLAVWLNQRGISCLLPDLRAHGKSGGRTSTFGALENRDIGAAIAFVRAREPQAKVVLIGSSMGAVACAMAAGSGQAVVDALVLDCAYSRLWVATLGWWRFLGGRILQALMSPTLIVGPLVTGINPFRMDVASALKNAGPIPALFLHGGADTLAPPVEAKRNLEACQGPAKIVWLDGQGHAEGRWNLPEVYLGAVQSFLDENGLLEKT